MIQSREVDGVAIALVHGGDAPPGERAVQGIAGTLAFDDSDELFLVLLERPRTASANLPSTSTWRSRESV